MGRSPSSASSDSLRNGLLPLLLSLMVVAGSVAGVAIRSGQNGIRDLMRQMAMMDNVVVPPFEYVEPPPPAEKKELHGNIHLEMNADELKFHFGVNEPDMVDPQNYQVVKIKPLHSWRGQRQPVVGGGLLGKRGGDPEGDGGDELPTDQPHLRVNAFGQNLHVPMRINDKLLSNFAKIVTVDTAGGQRPVDVVPSKRGSEHGGYTIIDAKKRSAMAPHPAASKVGAMVGAMNLARMGKRMSVAEESDDDDDDSARSAGSIEGCRHYTHSSENLLGAISNCKGEGYRGFVTDFSHIYEINPLEDRLFDRFQQQWADIRASGNGRADSDHEDGGSPHVVVRRSIGDAQGIFEADQFGKNRTEGPDSMAQLSSGTWSLLESIIKEEQQRSEAAQKTKRSGGSPSKKIIEMGIFVDDKAYSTYRRYYGDRVPKTEFEHRLIFLVLSVMNGVQAVYHYPKLEESLDLRIVYLELQESTKINMAGGEQTAAYKSFCDYENGVMRDLKATDDSHPQHWDSSLLISGWNFFGKGGDYATMGLAAVGGMCLPKYDCVIAEMGVKDPQNRPYPSTGFTSVFVIAHELGHNLGMTHDGSKNACPSNGFIMSPSRGTKGETLWSSCSVDVVRSLNKPCLEEGDRTQANAQGMDHNMFGGLPGLQFPPSKQCQVYLQDENARLYIGGDAVDPEAPNEAICTQMQCRVDGDNRGHYTAGPALEGTVCGKDHYCIKSECVRMSPQDLRQIQNQHQQVESLPPPPKEETGLNGQAQWGEWSPWTDCQSDCILKSKGIRNRYRSCRYPSGEDAPRDLAKAICPGSNTDVQLCDGNCRAFKTAESFAQNACQLYRTAEKRLEIELNGVGKQPPHNPSHPDQACTVYCEMKARSGRYYSPQADLSGMDGIDAFFPDGTLCHSEGSSTNYYCRKHLCLPESERGGRADEAAPNNLVINLNADPAPDAKPPEEIVKYFTIDDSGKRENEHIDKDSDKLSADKEFVLDDDELIVAPPV